ncbi:hypothetical protein SH584_01275 [Sphingomonas sp. LY29]|jgi:hypothetical protein|uniref:hypothetical protein n=1 Tax=unclassified Sphingomonas TaxID=196159 RepID=UPI002ADEF955|nr:MULTISPECIES: hypothetical protein [unclassified Sphingomonas]MEA1071173.1 hypothetical protein [Sphingomonas sp. LY160]WRP26107.1 hypothetical protein SH584_01275 [Sphingomonas sp. LY29]
MSGIAAGALSLTVIAAALLLIFGFRQAIRPDTRKRGILMIVCGLVFIGNVLILTL